jgi:hypothetical protein
MYEFGVAVDLAAGESSRVGLIRIALDAHDLALVDMGNERAHVRAIMGANDTNFIHQAASRGTRPAL